MYRKNTAGQFICVQLVLAASGAPATGLSPSGRRCLDGTFGAVGGSFTEDTGTGAYKLALAQADTNANNVSIIVTATGAIPVCVNFVTTAADPTDGVRLGLTALPNAAAGATGGLPTGDNAGKVALQADQAVNATKFAGQTITAAAGVTLPTEVASPTNITAGTIATVTNLTNLPSIPNDWLTAAGIAAGALDGKGNWNIGKTGYSLSQTFPTNFSTLAIDGSGAITFNNASVAATIADKTGFALTADYDPAKTAAQAGNAMALTANERNSVADALLDRDMSTGVDSGSPTVRTVRQALRFLRNKISIAGGTLTVTKENDTTASWTAVVTTDANALPIVTSDPAS